MNNVRFVRWAGMAAVCGLAMSAAMSMAQVIPMQARIITGPVDLKVNNVATPLGIDDTAPRFSWWLSDPARGARQTAYELLVSADAGKLQPGQADMWDSGKVASDQSLNVKYEGKALQPSTRYYWRVTLWGKDGNAYDSTGASWWETGLMSGHESHAQSDPWTAEWIGWETPEEAAVRHAKAEWVMSPDAPALQKEKTDEQRYDYRTTVTLSGPVKSAVLYATGQDTVSAWVNGSQAMKEDPLPPYKQMPWKKFVRADVTKSMKNGANAIAVELLHYFVNPNGQATEDAPPMIATLVVEYADGTMQTFSSDATWKVAVHAADGWQTASTDGAAWKQAESWRPQSAQNSSQQNSWELGHPWIPDSVKELKHSFDVGSPIKSARLYATSLGEYEMFLNGKRVGDAFFAPGWTDYRERVMYQTYDVTDMVKQGANTVGALLAPGWYETPLEWFQLPNNYGVTPPALRAELRIEHEDGSVEWIKSDATWQARRSYILHSELYDGEKQDGRMAGPMMSQADGEQGAWHDAETITPAKVRVMAETFAPVRVEKEMKAVKLTEPRPGVWVYDFGQNMAAVETVRVKGPAGTKVRLRFAEILNDDGTLYTENLRTAKATDYFTLSGKGVEEFTPQFTFHGFRYAELTGLPSDPGQDAVTANVIHTAAPLTAKLETGDELINRLTSNILWGQRSNFVSVPTDCPQRDERLGWMADAQVFWRTATYNMDLAAFTRKFGGDMRGTVDNAGFYGIYAPGTAKENMGHGAGWSDAGVIIPWTSWLQTGDTRVIDQNWGAMTKYVDAIGSRNSNGLWINDAGIPFGDWLSPEGKTNYGLIATAQWAYDATLLREMAHATGRTADEAKYAALFEKIRAAYDKAYVRDDGFVAGADNSASEFGVINNPNAKSKGGDTQTGYVLTLHMNLVPDAMRAKVAKHLVDKIEANHGLLATGFLGTPYLLEELTKAGYERLAFNLLLNTRYPSWLYVVDHGGTTTWERWNGDQMKDDPSMNSYNHYAYGAVGDWMYRFAAGVDATPLDAGFHTVVLHPQFDARLGKVDFTYPSSYGVIKSAWTVTGNNAKWKVTIPANTTGTISEKEVTRWKLTSASNTGVEKSAEGLKLEPGTYTFNAALK
ncbi:MAG: family 78 glycoside hydrolase catalytic domain [Acidobacteriota bacterium]|nr:family 78 glycoside hydrolase catalytic domain [Acidobacteriota bacterium]